jgi:hypothetical protein
MKMSSVGFVTLAMTLLSSGVFGCGTAQMSSKHAAEQNLAQSAVSRHPAAEEEVVRQFARSLAKSSSLEGESAVEDAIVSLVNENPSRYSMKQVQSFEDLVAISKDDQKKLVESLAADPQLIRTLSLSDSKVVQAASDEALASSEVSAARTQTIVDIHHMSGDSTSSDEPSFATALRLDPTLGDDIHQMLVENKKIEEKTGASVLAQGCEKLRTKDSVEEIATAISLVGKDAEKGVARDPATVSKSLQKHMGEVLLTDDKETESRICELARPIKEGEGCEVFTPQMCSQ